MDIVAGEIGGTSVLLNKGKGKFTDDLWIPFPGVSNCGAGADFNGDGKPDLALPTSTGITIMLGAGRASSPYTTGTTIAVSGPGCPITRDINGDGIPDLVFLTSAGAETYLGNGDGTFKLASTTAISPGNLALGDFNHDGKLDLASSGNQLALGNGDGTFRTPVTIDPNPPPYGYGGIAAGDLNGDGWADLVLTQAEDDGLYVLLNNQRGHFIPSKIVNDGGPTVPVLVDLENNGILDVVVALSVDYAAVYLNDGKGNLTFTQQIIYPAGEWFTPMTVGDVNGDGIPDILLPGGGDVRVALGNGDGTFNIVPTNFGVGPEAGQIFLQNLHGQSPKSGKPDIVAPDLSGGIAVLINTTK